MGPSGRVLLAVLCVSLAVCVLGRPQPSSASPQYSPLQVSENSSLQGSHHIVGVLHSATLEVLPWRRSLKRRTVVAGGPAGGGGGGGGLSTTDTIILVVSIVTFVVVVTALTLWCRSKKRKNPNWSPTDCFKRNKVPREKMLNSSAMSDFDPDDADAEHTVSFDGPRMDHTKSRKQVMSAI